LIALLTVPNTGTHYILNLLNLSNQITAHISTTEAYWGVGRREMSRFVLRYKPLPEDHSKIVYQSHILDRPTHREMDLIAMGHKAVIPMRDPLSSLISRKNRNPEEPMYHHVDAFEYVATSPWIAKSFIFPIDTKGFKSNWKFRQSMGRALFNYCNLDIPKQLEVWAKDNEHKNTMGKYNEKLCYLDGNLKDATAKCVGEFEYLKSKKDVIIPFLKRLGYEDLMWW
jgi:hypothetical protein